MPHRISARACSAAAQQPQATAHWCRHGVSQAGCQAVWCIRQCSSSQLTESPQQACRCLPEHAAAPFGGMGGKQFSYMTYICHTK